MANMHDVLIAVELAISLRFGAFVLKWFLRNIAWVFWTATPYVFLLPIHLMFVQAIPVLAFFRCMTGMEMSMETWDKCVDVSGMLNTYTELLNPDTMQQDLDLIRSSMDLVYNGSLVVMHRMLGV
jgi:hypothetical protein